MFRENTIFVIDKIPLHPDEMASQARWNGFVGCSLETPALKQEADVLQCLILQKIKHYRTTDFL